MASVALFTPASASSKCDAPTRDFELEATVTGNELAASRPLDRMIAVSCGTMSAQQQ